ncbi:hypothetical protein PoB_005906900 [Plakobranchus ocellatus]|uniref:MADF domain-containing protein n=1 Tax=Plakobranchus ocellatus TaxID=259542 RepID=A0AAV4CMW2_9GAST|nr:hypothetical protein PoB_005906900 [Plakobranchus ocellatus]
MATQAGVVTADPIARKRYDDKIACIGVDPYKIKSEEWIKEVEDYSPIAYEHIVRGKIADIAKKRWQNLRSSFSRSRATQQLPSGSAANSKSKRPFYLAQQTSFLAEYMAHGTMMGSYGVSLPSITEGHSLSSWSHLHPHLHRLHLMSLHYLS